MSTLWNLQIDAPDVEQPVISGETRETALNLANFFRKLAGGNQLGSVTLTARNSGVKASATATCAAVANADTVTINGTALTATQHNATNTVTPTVTGIDVADTLTVNGVVLTARKHNATATCTIVIANTDLADTVTVNGVVFTAAAAEDLEAAEFDISGDATAAATSLVDCIMASEDPLIDGIVTATSSLGVVTIRAVATGTAGNAITLVSSDADGLAVTGSGFLADATAVAADEFDISGSNAQCVTSIADAIAANATLAALFTTTTSATVCTIRAITAGTAANAYTLASSDAQIAVGNATFQNGAAVGNNEFDFTGSNTETATALAAAINASTTGAISDFVTATSSAGVVTVTADVAGVSGNAITFVSSDGTRLAVTGSGKLASGSETLITLSF